MIQPKESASASVLHGIGFRRLDGFSRFLSDLSCPSPECPLSGSRGLLRTVYFTILTSHTILAVVIVPLVLRTLYLAVNNRFEDHRRWARWTLPFWFYVSVTGVVIYEMLY